LLVFSQFPTLFYQRQLQRYATMDSASGQSMSAWRWPS
jgi:hypothetical protein